MPSGIVDVSLLDDEAPLVECARCGYDAVALLVMTLVADAGVTRMPGGAVCLRCAGGG